MYSFKFESGCFIVFPCMQAVWNHCRAIIANMTGLGIAHFLSQCGLKLNTSSVICGRACVLFVEGTMSLATFFRWCRVPHGVLFFRGCRVPRPCRLGLSLDCFFRGCCIPCGVLFLVGAVSLVVCCFWRVPCPSPLLAVAKLADCHSPHPWPPSNPAHLWHWCPLVVHFSWHRMPSRWNH